LIFPAKHVIPAGCKEFDGHRPPLQEKLGAEAAAVAA
jgi:hypothetical protein